MVVSAFNCSTWERGRDRPCVFEASEGNLATSRPARASQWDPLSKQAVGCGGAHLRSWQDEYHQFKTNLGYRWKPCLKIMKGKKSIDWNIGEFARFQ